MPEARQILKIGTWYNSTEETLLKLGLPQTAKVKRASSVTRHGRKVMAARAGGSDGHPLAGQE